MTLGRYLRELWRNPVGVVLSFLIAALVALWSVADVRLSPPGLSFRQQEMAAASTRVLVDMPKPMVLDLVANTYDFQAVTNRALLVGNIMGTAPVRKHIAEHAGVPADDLDIAAPVTRAWPRHLESSGKKKTSDIGKSPDEYRISIQVNPTVPIVDVYARAPTEAAAERLANGAVYGMRDYLREISARQQVAPQDQVHLEQLGRADGGVINKGVRRNVAILTFLLVFGACALVVLFVGRVRRGWALEAASEPHRHRPEPVEPTTT